LKLWLGIATKEGGGTMNTRTIMIFPELENINIINDIRKKYDPLADVLLPHITLVFPFDSTLNNNELTLYLEECLRDIHPFKVELNGFSKQQNKFGNYLMIDVVKGIDVIKIIHDRLYRDQLKPFEPDYDYVPHMTVGRVSSMELLDKAFAEVDGCNYKFRTEVNKITVEMIGEHEESIIIIEHELN
jgi:2'-5' RNA ligase